MRELAIVAAPFAIAFGVIVLAGAMLALLSTGLRLIDGQGVVSACSGLVVDLRRFWLNP